MIQKEWKREGIGERQGEDKEEKKRKLRDRTFKTRVVQGVGITTIVFSLLTLALNYETVALIASFVAVPVSVLVIIYQFKLQDTDCEYREVSLGLVACCNPRTLYVIKA